MVVPGASRHGGQGVGKDETRLAPRAAPVHRERHPDLAAVGLLEVAARMAVVVKGHECLAVGVVKQHRRRVGMNQHGRFRLGPSAPIVVGAGFPEVPFARAHKDHGLPTAEADRARLVHALELLEVPAAGPGLRMHRPCFAPVVAPQHIRASDYRCLGGPRPTSLVRTQQPSAGVGLAHSHHRHAQETGVVLRADQRCLRPRVPVVVGVPKADWAVLPAFTLTGDRLRAEGVDPFRAAWDQRNESVLTVIDVERHPGAHPRFALVRRAIGDHRVDLALLATVVAAVGKHQQVVAAGRNRRPGFEEVLLRFVHQPTVDRRSGHKPETAADDKRLGRRGGIERHPADPDLLSQGIPHAGAVTGASPFRVRPVGFLEVFLHRILSSKIII